MTDITLLVMVADNPVAESPGRWRRGDIVDVFSLAQCPGAAGHPRHLHIHVTGVPGTLQQIKNKVAIDHREGDGAGENAALVAQRRWVVDHGSIPAGVLQQLKQDKELTVTWTKAKDYVRRRNTNVLTLGAFIADADLS